ncbi:MAG: alpha/beta fold hydrolase [Acidimicrobiales bacterium]
MDDADLTARLLARRAPVHADVSADGRVLLTTVRVPEGTTELEVALSVLDVADGTERPLAGAVDGDSAATWAPDGHGVVWCSTAGERPVLRRAASTDDESLVVPGSAGVQGPAAWSPDGRHLAFVAPATDPIDRSRPYRWTRPYLHFDGTGPLETPPQVRVVDLATAEARWLTDDDWRWGTLRWSPDGTRLAACAGLDPDGLVGGQHLELLGLDGTRVRPDLPAGRVVLPAWHPDGRLFVLVVDPHDRAIGSPAALYVWDGERAVEAQVDGLLGGDVYGDQQAELCDTYDHVLLVAPDGSFVGRTFDRGRMGIARLSIDSPSAGPSHGLRVTLDPIVGGDRCATPVGVFGDRLVFVTASAGATAELASVGLHAGDERRITDFAVGAAPTVAVQRLAVTTDAPAPVDAWFVHPVGATLPLPTVLVVHGGPNFAYGDTFNVDVHALCAAGFAVVYANPRGSTGSGDAFTAAGRADWTEGPTRDLLAVVDEVVRRGWSIGDRLGVTGNSYGGFMSAWLAATTDRFRAAVIENPVTDPASMHATSDIGPWFFEAQFGGAPHEVPERYAAQTPLHHAHRCRTPVLWVVGEADRRCPPAQAFAMHRAVRRAGTPSEVLVLPASSHEGSTYGPPAGRLAHDRALVEWMRRWVLA